MSTEYAIVNQYIRRTRDASGHQPHSPYTHQRKEPNFHIDKENKTKDKIVIPLLKLN